MIFVNLEVVDPNEMRRINFSLVKYYETVHTPKGEKTQTRLVFLDGDTVTVKGTPIEIQGKIEKAQRFARTGEWSE